MAQNQGKCARCGKAFVAEGIGAGYGITGDGERLCYECCGIEERRLMAEHGRTALYLVGEAGSREVVDWPGTLRFKVNGISKGRHNIAGTRYDVWFTGPATDGSNTARWYGVQYGEMTQIVHCRRLKAVAS